MAAPQPAKSVQFDLGSEPTPTDQPRHRRSKHDDNRGDKENRRRNSRRDRGSHHDHSRTDSPDSASSSDTIDLPPRFDERGNPKPQKGDDPLVDRLDDILSGKGTAGKIFSRLADDLLAGAGSRR